MRFDRGHARSHSGAETRVTSGRKTNPKNDQDYSRQDEVHRRTEKKPPRGEKPKPNPPIAKRIDDEDYESPDFKKKDRSTEEPEAHS